MNMLTICSIGLFILLATTIQQGEAGLGSACSAQPCQHGKCQVIGVLEGDYMCTCDAEWTGHNCDIRECSGPKFGYTTCFNGGKCDNTSHDYATCECTNGWTGYQCEYKDCISSLYCLNGGTCYEYQDQHSCLCAPGWGGPNCEKASVHTTACPDGWTSFNGSCYYFGHNLVTFDEAEHYCLQHGGHLVHLDSMTENSFITTRLADRQSDLVSDASWWIGLQHLFATSGWRWVDDFTKPEFTGPDIYYQPIVARFANDLFSSVLDSVQRVFLVVDWNGDDDDGCVVMKVYKYTSVYSWTTKLCDSKHMPICERPAAKCREYQAVIVG